MRNIILLLLCLSTFAAWCQNDEEKTAALREIDSIYSKRKTNMIVGWSMIGAGVVMVVSSFAINMSSGFLDNDPSNNSKGVWLGYLGGVTALGSVPFFIAANKHKKAARLELRKQEMVIGDKNIRYNSVCLVIEF